MTALPALELVSAELAARAARDPHRHAGDLFQNFARTPTEKRRSDKA